MSDFLLLTVLIAFCVFYVVKAYRKIKRDRAAVNRSHPEAKVEIRIEQPEAYELYAGWCRERNEKALPVDIFEKLVNAKEDITIERLLDEHLELNKEIFNERLQDDFMNYYEKTERQKHGHDQKFLTSVAAGYATKSTLVGTLFGGDLFGALVGNRLRDRKKEK